MEMTNRRWIAIVVLACTVMAALELPPDGSIRRHFVQKRPTGSAAVARTMHQQLVNLSEVTELLSRRDTLLRLAAADSVSSGPVLIERTTLRPHERERLTKAVADQATAIGPGADRVIVGVVMDSASEVPKRANYRTERQVVLPRAADGRHCVTIVRLGRGRRDLDSAVIKGVFGPCAFHAAFGEPGAAVAEWLRKREYDVAFNASWPANAQPNTALLRVRRSTREEDMTRWMDFMRGFRHYDVSACSAGSEKACAEALQKSPGTRNDRFPDGVYRQMGSWEYASPLGHDATFFLSDLLASQGTARFQKFWSSGAADFDAAFSQAFGESPEKWTMRWMRYRYGRDTRGPYVAPRSAILTVVVSIGVVALTVAATAQREILS